MMTWQDVGTFVGKAAPVLGSVLAGSAGQQVGNLIATALGANNNPTDVMQTLQNDPQSLLKLVELQNNNTLALQTLQFQQIQEDNKNTESARQRQVDMAKSGKVDNTGTILAYIIISLYCVSLISMIYIAASPTLNIPANDVDKDVLNVVLGALIMQVAKIINFYFGGSSNAQLSSATDWFKKQIPWKDPDQS